MYNVSGDSIIFYGSARHDQESYVKVKSSSKEAFVVVTLQTLQAVISRAMPISLQSSFQKKESWYNDVLNLNRATSWIY